MANRKITVLRGQIKSAHADFGKGRIKITIETGLNPDTLKLRDDLMKFIREESIVTTNIQPWQHTMDLEEMVDKATGEIID